MFAELGAKLVEWQAREDVQWILWRGEEPVGKTKAFCAGGELSEVVSASAGIASFIGPEYQLDYYVSQFSKPQMAIWNGIVMGAGFGLTGNAQIRIATENFQFAMPEARFGLNADIGCAHILTKHCPEYLGTYLTLTADRIRGSFDEGLWSGICTDSIASNQLSSLYHALLRTTSEYFIEMDGRTQDGPAHNSNKLITTSSSSQLFMLLRTIVKAGFSATETKPRPARLQRLYPNIKRIFGLPTLAKIYEELKSWKPVIASGTTSPEQEEQAQEEADWIKFCLHAFEVDCCPTSMAANFEAMKRAKSKTFTYAENLINDYRAAVRLALREDIRKGAQGILQKTGPPIWNPSSVLQVSEEEIHALYEPLSQKPTESENKDLELPGPYPC